MVVSRGVELRSSDYKSPVLPLNYPTKLSGLCMAICSALAQNSKNLSDAFVILPLTPSINHTLSCVSLPCFTCLPTSGLEPAAGTIVGIWYAARGGGLTATPKPHKGGDDKKGGETGKTISCVFYLSALIITLYIVYVNHFYHKILCYHRRRNTSTRLPPLNTSSASMARLSAASSCGFLPICVKVVSSSMNA